MKKVLFTLLFASSCMFAAAQGAKYGPKAGQYAVSVDATPVLNYVGNLFSGSTDKNTMDDLEFVNDFCIYGKKYITDTKAIRLGVNLDIYSEKENTPEPVSAGNLESTTWSGSEITLIGGLEYRIGSGRLQGFYGPMALIGFGTGETIKYSYNSPVNGTLLKDNEGSMFGIGVGGFGGAEYFLGKQVALGAEFNVVMSYMSTGKDVLEYQGNPDVKGGTSSAFNLGFGSGVSFVPSGRMFLTLFF